MREFDLIMPQTLSVALDALAGNDPRVQLIAGGTDMVVDVRGGRARPDVLVALHALPELRGISRQDGALRIGAATPVAELLSHPLIREQADLLSQAARVFANPMIRNLATIGGNIGSASPAGDLLPPLLALDAQIELAGQNSTRAMPLADFFLGPRKTARRADEIILSIRIPLPPPRTAGAFFKLGLRQADAIAVVSAAVWLERDGDRVREVRIALGAVAPRPMRAPRAEEILRGQTFGESLVAECARLASQECSPIDDLRGSAAYRRRMVGVLVKRTLQQAWQATRE